MRDAAVLEDERKAVGHAGFLQQAPGLGAVGVDVVPVAGELFQLGGGVAYGVPGTWMPATSLTR